VYGGIAIDRGDLDAGTAQPADQMVGRSHPVGGHHHPVALGQQSPEPPGHAIDIVDDQVPTPPGGGDCVHAGTVGHGIDRPDRGARVDHEALPVGVQPGELHPVGSPGGSQRGRQVGLLGLQVGYAVPESPGLHGDDQSVVVNQVE